MTNTTSLELNEQDVLWTLTQISDYFQAKPRTVRDVWSKRPDFPRAVCPSGRRHRRWKKVDIIEWANNQREARK